MLKYFDCVTDSGELGVAKPDKRIFRRALRKLKCPASKSAMVGDSIKRDMLGAEKTGMRHFWIKSPFSADIPCCKKVRILKSVNDLRKMKI